MTIKLKKIDYLQRFTDKLTDFEVVKPKKQIVKETVEVVGEVWHPYGNPYAKGQRGGSGGGGGGIKRIDIDKIPIVKRGSERLATIQKKIVKDTKYLEPVMGNDYKGMSYLNRSRSIKNGVPTISTKYSGIVPNHDKTSKYKNKFQEVTNQVAIAHVYRAISVAELKSIQKSGYIKSNGSMNMTVENKKNMTVFKETDPSWYLPKEGGHIIKVKVSKSNGWEYLIDNYPKATKPIPISQIMEIDGRTVNSYAKTRVSK